MGALGAPLSKNRPADRANGRQCNSSA